VIQKLGLNSKNRVFLELRSPRSSEVITDDMNMIFGAMDGYSFIKCENVSDTMGGRLGGRQVC